MRTRLSFFILFFACLTATAQEVPDAADRNHTVYAEFFGNGIIFSVNYETRLARGRQDGHGVRVGIGGFPINEADILYNRATGTIFVVPLAYNYLIGKRRSAFELGAGLTPMVGRIEVVESSGEVNRDTDLTVAGFFNAGYRYQPLNSGFVFRFTWTPSITTEGFHPVWIGLSLGYGFK